VFNTESRQIEEDQRRSEYLLASLSISCRDSDSHRPEDYCYYGVEGNPVFTDRLQSLEDFILDTRPRPLQHIHFFTTSVGAGKDGMTKHCTWIRSIRIRTIGAVVFSMGIRMSGRVPQLRGGTVERFATDVMGFTIGTLMRQTLAFDPHATPEDKKLHDFFEVDIEGGNSTLCRLRKKVLSRRQDGQPGRFVY
jgi:hypothetical protein